MGPHIEPCGSSHKSIWKTLLLPYIFTPSFPRFKEECTKFTASYDKTYTWNFAASKSWRIQSPALERSIRTVPTKVLLSRDFFQFSISLNKTWSEL